MEGSPLSYGGHAAHRRVTLNDPVPGCYAEIGRGSVGTSEASNVDVQYYEEDGVKLVYPYGKINGGEHDVTGLSVTNGHSKQAVELRYDVPEQREKLEALIGSANKRQRKYFELPGKKKFLVFGQVTNYCSRYLCYRASTNSLLPPQYGMKWDLDDDANSVEGDNRTNVHHGFIFPLPGQVVTLSNETEREHPPGVTWATLLPDLGSVPSVQWQLCCTRLAMRPHEYQAALAVLRGGAEPRPDTDRDPDTTLVVRALLHTLDEPEYASDFDRAWSLLCLIDSKKLTLQTIPKELLDQQTGVSRSEFGRETLHFAIRALNNFANSDSCDIHDELDATFRVREVLQNVLTVQALLVHGYINDLRTAQEHEAYLEKCRHTSTNLRELIGAAWRRKFTVEYAECLKIMPTASVKMTLLTQPLASEIVVSSPFDLHLSNGDVYHIDQCLPSVDLEDKANSCTLISSSIAHVATVVHKLPIVMHLPDVGDPPPEGISSAVSSGKTSHVEMLAKAFDQMCDIRTPKVLVDLLPPLLLRDLLNCASQCCGYRKHDNVRCKNRRKQPQPVFCHHHKNQEADFVKYVAMRKVPGSEDAEAWAPDWWKNM